MPLVGAQAALLIAVPFALAPGRMVFDVWTAQAYRGAQFFDVSNPLGAQLRDKALFLPTLMTWYPATITLTAGVAILLTATWRRGWRPSLATLSQWPTAHLLMLSFVALLFLPHLALNRIDEYYFVPAFPIAALLGASAASRLAEALPRVTERLLMPSLVASLVLVEAFAFAYGFVHYMNTNNPDLRQLQNVGAYLKSVVPPDRRVLAYDTSVVFEADRRVSPGLEMELFSYWPHLSTDEARRDGVVNYEMLQQIGDDESTGAIVMTTWDEIRTASTGPDSADYLQVAGRTEFASIILDKAKYYLAKEYPKLGGVNDSIYVYLRAN